MSDFSTRLSLPYIQSNQAQKHVTHNESLRIIDSLLQLSVVSSSATPPPVTPNAGDHYIVPAASTGAWTGQDNAVAVWADGTWLFHAPQIGWRAWDSTLSQILVFDGTTWVAATQDISTLDQLGINTGADQTNRLAVSADATLLTHDVSGDHRAKINKNTATDTASLLFQTSWTGHAEMGTMGSNDFQVKVSPDGVTYYTGLHVDHTTGHTHFPNGVSGLTDSQFGPEVVVTTDYVASRGQSLFTNATGLLGNAYNFPDNFVFDSVVTPNTPGSFGFAGHHSGPCISHEFLPVDPNKVYSLSTYIRQDAVPGDWSAFFYEDRHQHYMGLMAFDVDKNPINALHHMRYRHGGADSYTTLTQPLTPGDMVIHVADATGWNDNPSVTYGSATGIIIFGYENSFGGQYDHYSRFVRFNMFTPAGVDKTNNSIALQNSVPASMGNPADPNGTWPVGTKIANSHSGLTYKYSFFSGLVLDDTDQWYQVSNHMGGIDRSGTNILENFPPGTAFVKVFWLPNYSNKLGGTSSFPDTGVDHQIRFSGISISKDPLAVQVQQPDGSVALHVPHSDATTGTIQLQPQGMEVSPL